MAGIIQDKCELESFYATEDPWGYRSNPEDARRRDLILAELPPRRFRNAIDIGCGEGFLTCRLPADHITGADLSENAIRHARQHPENEGCEFIAAGLLDLPGVLDGRQFDLVVITGLIYPQYFGRSNILIYEAVDRLLEPGGILLTSHIDEWYRARFPYLLLRYSLFPYREYSQRVEIYVK